MFADLGLKNPEELLRQGRAGPTHLRYHCREKAHPGQGGRYFGIDQPKISALMRGKLDGFSTDRLFRFLNALGSDVEIVIRPAPRAGQTQIHGSLQCESSVRRRR